MRLIRDATIDATTMVRFWLPVLLHSADPNLAAGRVVLREWVTSRDPKKIIAAASLLRGFDHSVVFLEHELIADLLVAANGAAPSVFRIRAASCLVSPSAACIPAPQANRHLATCTTRPNPNVWPRPGDPYC